MFGSIHFAKPELYPLPDAVEAAFDSAANLVVEVNISPELEAKLGAMTIEMASYADGQTLSANLSDPVAELLGSYLSGNGMLVAAFDRFEPWFVGLAISVIEVQKLGLDPDLGIDRHFLDKAKDTKPILELETAEQQLGLFDGLSPELQLQMLEKTLREAPEIEENMERMIQAWKAGDASEIEEMVFESLGESPHLKPVFDKIFTERNHTMTQKIAGYLEGGSSYFVVVGAGHLVGKEGIVSLLKKRGFEVERR